MASLVVAATVADGHTAPMLAVARHFADRGHDVRFLGGVRFADAVRDTGATFVAWPEDAQVDHQAIGRSVRDAGGIRSGPIAMSREVERIFVAPAPGQYRALDAEVAARPIDAILTDLTVVGAAALTLSPRPRSPVIACGLLPLGLSSRDTAPFGTGILPGRGPLAQVRNRALNALARHVLLRGGQRAAERAVHDLGGGDLDVFFMDWALSADHIAQFSVSGFEYPRSDVPAHLSFIGPVWGRSRGEAELPMWWGDLSDAQAVVHVSQGTVANQRLDDLVIPTIRALADEDVLVVVTTGGAAVSRLGRLPANVRAAEFLPYDRLLPLTDVFVTNGGYGGLQYALAHGVPIVAAGDTEDKVETTRRVEFSGVGVNLRTGTPTPAQIARAVAQVRADARFRTRARALRDEIARAPGLPGLERTVLDLIAARREA